MIVGVDVDGVLASFDTAFTQKLIEVTGENKFPDGPVVPKEWDWPQAAGYSDQQVSRTWDAVKDDPWFWEQLPELPGTAEGLLYLEDLRQFHDADVYFVTNRMGLDPKGQTERWLRKRLSMRNPNPTVLIASNKGAIAKGLRLDYYIDDKPENCEDVVTQSKGTRVALLDQPWNANRFEGELVARVYQVAGFVETIDMVLQ